MKILMKRLITGKGKLNYLNFSPVLLSSNIKSLWKINTRTIQSRDSDFKNVTKDSQEYSYGADVRKMEPKIQEITSENNEGIDKVLFHRILGPKPSEA
jgi:hypothetical protein